MTMNTVCRCSGSRAPVALRSREQHGACRANKDLAALCTARLAVDVLWITGKSKTMNTVSRCSGSGAPLALRSREQHLF